MPIRIRLTSRHLSQSLSMSLLRLFSESNAEYSLLEGLLKVEREAHLVLEAAMVGLFGICIPFFALEAGAPFNCRAPDSNTTLLEQGLYLPLPEVRIDLMEHTLVGSPYRWHFSSHGRQNRSGINHTPRTRESRYSHLHDDKSDYYR